MCGIVGIVSKIPQYQRAWLAIGRDVMTYRGPVEAGKWWAEDCRVGFAHRRQSIIDLSFAGHQPMSDATCTLSIVSNGEIYNFSNLRDELVAKGHLFKFHSDTEVIMSAYREWCTQCVARLNGMFVFAFYDTLQQTVFLTLVRAVEKPLFFHHVAGVLRFASVLKSLLAAPVFPRKIDLNPLH